MLYVYKKKPKKYVQNKATAEIMTKKYHISNSNGYA